MQGRHTQREKWKGVRARGALKKLKVGKASGIDGKAAEKLKYGGDIIVEWILWMCDLARQPGEVPKVVKSHHSTTL